MQANTQKINKDLQKWFSGSSKVVVAGVGNPLRRDDFVGVEIVRYLNKEPSKKIFLIECETVPENFIEPIINFQPSHLLIVDAALLNLKPGACRLIHPEKIRGVPVSTHALPLYLFCECVKKMTGAKIALLAIQPSDTSFGEGLTKELRKTARQLTALLRRILPK